MGLLLSSPSLVFLLLLCFLGSPAVSACLRAMWPSNVQVAVSSFSTSFCFVGSALGAAPPYSSCSCAFGLRPLCSRCFCLRLVLSRSCLCKSARNAPGFLRSLLLMFDNSCVNVRERFGKTLGSIVVVLLLFGFQRFPK